MKSHWLWLLILIVAIFFVIWMWSSTSTSRRLWNIVSELIKGKQEEILKDLEAEVERLNLDKDVLLKEKFTKTEQIKKLNNEIARLRKENEILKNKPITIPSNIDDILRDLRGRGYNPIQQK